MKARRATLLLCLAAALLLPPAQADLLEAAQGPVAVDAQADVPTTADGLDDASVHVDATAAGGDASVKVGLPDPLPAVDDPVETATGLLAPRSVREDIVTYAPPAAGSALAVVAAGLAWRALAALFPGVFPAIPLFSRIERGQLLDNPVRARIHEAILQGPGLSLSEVATQAGVAWGTAVHHLRRLESNGLVVSTEQRGHRRFFIANTRAASQRAAVAVVMHPTARRIAHLVSQRPGIDQTGICNALDLNNPAASKHLGHFEQQGLVLSQRAGRSRLYYAQSGLHSALDLLEGPATGSPHAQPIAMGPMAAV